MKRIHQSTVWGLLLAALLGLTLTLVMLTAPEAVAQSTGVDEEVLPARDNETRPVRSVTVVTPTTEFSRPVISLPWIEVVTVTAPPPRVPDWATEPGSAGPQATANDAMSITKSAPEVVLLGDELWYTILISNQSEYSATVLVEDVLPVKTLDSEVQCDPDCSRSYEVVIVTVNMPSQFGAQPYTETITTVHRVYWDGLVLVPEEVKTLEFSMRVSGQSDGTVLTNLAYAKYTLADGSGGSVTSNETATEVEVYVQPGAGASVSSEATWEGEGYGGTGSLDWGDYDHDGYLDLAIGSSDGATVYRNEQGQLERLWSSGRYSHDVHWVDIDGDGQLELISIGYNWWDDSIQNFVYERSADGGRFLEIEEAVSFADDQLLRVVPSDYDGDGYLDLIALTYDKWTVDGCTIRVYRNSGGSFAEPYECILDPLTDYGATTENLLALGDYDNDDDLDLVMDVYDYENPYYDPTVPTLTCAFRDMLWILENSAESFTGTQSFYTATQPVTVDLYYDCNWPIDVAWGDYDHDGYLDLAAAIPSLSGPDDHQVQIYRNLSGNEFTTTFTFTWPYSHPAPYAVTWGDYDGDGYLDLAAGAYPFRIYRNDGGSFSADRYISPSEDPRSGVALDLAGADYDNDGDVDLAAGNPFAASSLFTTFAAPLNATLSPIASWSGSGVAWGDVDGDGYLDLLFGASQNTAGAELYYNDEGWFPTSYRYPASGFGPHSVAFGDVAGDGAQDVALGTPAGTQVYLSSNRSSPDWTSPGFLAGQSVAWADADDDGDLDLFVGSDTTNALFVNQSGTLDASPAWLSTGEADTRSVTWADVDGDAYPDVAIGNFGSPSQMYHNDGTISFSPVWTAPYTLSTTAVAWADYDADGDMDLAVGNYGQANQIYENESGTLGEEPVWTSTELSKTTSLAWGDVDNDGDLDLAVGNDGEYDQIYVNLGSRPGLPRFLWIWYSTEKYPTTGLAWGDRDNDGDLDLALSSETEIGIYENFYVWPSHLTDDFPQTMPLAENPPYLFVDRPEGTSSGTDNAYFFSSAAILGGRESPTVTINYQFHSPDGTRVMTRENELGVPITGTLFEYSLDGGGTWQTATPLAGSPDPVSTTLRLGQQGTFLWDAQTDAAISDDARFRISIISLNNTGGQRRTLTRAVSPPFRVRGTSCIWPEDPTIIVETANPRRASPIRFVGTVERGDGTLTFLWDFGDGETAQWQEGDHTYGANGVYDVKLTVQSSPCPQIKEVYAQISLVVGTGRPDLYLPIIMQGWGDSSSSVLVIEELVYDASDEYITITNQGSGAQSMTGWRIRSDVGPQEYDFPDGYSLGAGASVRIHSGPDAYEAQPTDLLWGYSHVWLDEGDKAILYDDADQLIDSYCYADGC
jgi:uncharacterized repeat protein (TIGR01451 family)